MQFYSGCLSVLVCSLLCLADGGQVDLVGGSPKQRHAWREWLGDVDREIGFLIRDKGSALPVTFVLDGPLTTYTRTASGYRFPLSTSKPDRVLQAELVRALLYRRLRKQGGAGDLQPRHMPAWLVAGIQTRVRWRRAQVVHADQFVASRYLLQKKSLPSIKTLVNQPIPADQPLLYDVYADVAACLLQVLIRTDPAVLRQILSRIALRRRAYEALLPLLPANQTASQLKTWFVARARRVVNGPGVMVTPKDVVNRLAEIETLTLPDPESTEPERILLDKALRERSDYKPDSHDLAARIARLYRLQQDAPSLLRAPITGYIKAFAGLQAGRRGEYMTDIQAARKAFADALQRTIAISKYLREQERHQFANARRLQAYLPLTKAGMEPTVYEKAVAQYLDSVARRIESNPALPSPAAP